ncbi:MAG: beta-phosphoglucomutase [Oscillospiraceae bacterium]|jgi:beta-phosphoglucomutase|nr:beta-phosphoglucomutase [Oscillospiraceae bacterium]
MQNGINAIIFDLDGVIVHTDKYHYKAWKLLADRLGLYFDESVNNRLRGVSRMESLEIILENSDYARLSENEKTALADEKNEKYKEFLQSMTPEELSGEVYDTLNALRERGYRLAIGSSSRNARLILDKIGLGGFFDAISDGNNIINSKPDPEVFLKAAEFLSAKPEECAVVEDADAGITAAHRAGMKAAAIGDAVRYGNGDWNLDNFAALADIFK